MPREPSFSAADVLQAAADTFTLHGYHGTSMSLLTQATGLGKQSLYNSFGDKRALYLQAVDCATERFGAVASAMARCHNGRAALQRFFEQLRADCSSGDPARQQCVVSAGLLEGIAEEGVQAHLRSKWQATHELLRASVERGQKDGSIANPAPSAELADHLLAVVGGLRIAAQAGMTAPRLKRTLDIGLALLDSPEHT
jgi:TetR/AcrR family transcriptional regulator, transcriptional repressor for nem operon